MVPDTDGLTASGEAGGTRWGINEAVDADGRYRESSARAD
jgi:hypothetical protein